MVYGPDDTDYPEHREDPYRQAPVNRPADARPYSQQPRSVGRPAARPVAGPAARPAPLDPFRIREHGEHQGQGQSTRGRAPRADQWAAGSGSSAGTGTDLLDQEARDRFERAQYDQGRRSRDPQGHRGGDLYDEDLYDRGDDFRRGEDFRDGDEQPDPPLRSRVGAQRAGATSHRKGKRGKPKKVVSAKVKRRRKYIFRSVLGVFLLIFGYVGVTIYPYITQPGTDPMEARVAEWGRDHHLGFAVTWLENHTYQAPATGGSLSASQLAQMAAPSAKPLPTNVPVVDLPANIVPLASPPDPGEGVWQPVTTDSAGVPILEKAVLRPDAQHTSELAYVAWMKQSALKFTLNPGYQQPGGSWKEPDQLKQGQNTGLVATWNGGFKLTPNDDALGGFYADGRSALPLVDGKASEVFYQDGSIKIGQWGRDETMGPTVTGVRQNLSLLVDQGQVMADSGAGSSAKWGITVSNAFFVPRSGVGMTAKGDIVYVGGADLSVLTLAQLLKAAGAVYGMELDINTAWVSYMTYSPGSDPADPTPEKLWNFQQAANRYYQSSDRDFVSVFTR